MSDTAYDTSVMFFCLGNICRSPLAEAVFSHKLEQRDLAERIRVASSGTSAYHVGESPDPGSREVALERIGRDISDQRSQQLDAGHLRDFDYLVAMDRSNRRRARSLDGAGDARILLLREFEPADGERSGEALDVPDPYGAAQSQFDLVYDIVERCTDQFLAYLLDENPHLGG